MKRKAKIILALVIGFIVAMLIMAIAIFFGYTKAYSTNAETLLVRLAGIPIYQLTKNGSEYIGESKSVLMGSVCGFCMALSVAMEEIIGRIRKR